MPDPSPRYGAVLRLEAEEKIVHLPIFAEINDSELLPMVPNGELFAPPSLEALPDPLNLRQYRVDLRTLKPGLNRILVKNRWPASGGSGYCRGRIHLLRIELALYR